MKNTQIRLVEIPRGHLEESHFATVEADGPTPAAGEVLVRTVLISQDAANRAWMQGATYREAVKAGDVMHAYSLGRVLESRDERFRAGDFVLGEGGWQTCYVLPASR
ncbi:MAG: NADP-dependent oxidoreductase, partial [Candidatus Binatia bacterium]